jgi:hypothetical protein
MRAVILPAEWIYLVTYAPFSARIKMKTTLSGRLPDRHKPWAPVLVGDAKRLETLRSYPRSKAAQMFRKGSAKSRVMVDHAGEDRAAEPREPGPVRHGHHPRPKMLLEQVNRVRPAQERKTPGHMQAPNGPHRS